jgi:hypothetical protein
MVFGREKFGIFLAVKADRESRGIAPPIFDAARSV